MLDGSRVEVVGEAADAKTALVVVKKLQPDVMLVDVGIEASTGGDCFELADIVRQASPGTHVITITAIDNPTSMARAKPAGAMDYLLEGVTTKALTAAVEGGSSRVCRDRWLEWSARRRGGKRRRAVGEG